jgi:hypothetical protein
VGNKKEYIERLQMAVETLHHCKARHVESVPVHEIFNGETVWQGEVEIFGISGHPKAKRAYGWSHAAGKDNSDERFVTVLELPPVDSAVNAVRVSLVKQIRRMKQ